MLLVTRRHSPDPAPSFEVMKTLPLVVSMLTVSFATRAFSVGVKIPVDELGCKRDVCCAVVPSQISTVTICRSIARNGYRFVIKRVRVSGTAAWSAPRHAPGPSALTSLPTKRARSKGAR